ATLPFDRCAAHLGAHAWHGSGGGGLQVRAYELGETVEDVECAIKTREASEVERWTGYHAVVRREAKLTWRKSVLSYQRWYVDYGGTAVVEFRLRPHGERTFVFVFMYVGEQSQETTIAAILDSFQEL